MGCRELQVNDYFRMADSASGTDVPYYALADANKNITVKFGDRLIIKFGDRLIINH